VDVVITEEGLKLLKDLDPAIEEWEDRFNIITPEEAEQISALLDKLRENEGQA
jgi:DNA-binding MarR family transcriptional regulator